MTGGPQLRRSLTLGPLILYGVGVIVGAGIYVAIGAVIERAGGAAPLSFLLAGLVAAPSLPGGFRRRRGRRRMCGMGLGRTGWRW